MNAIVFTFVVASYIGLRECVEDALAWHPRLQTSVLRLLKDKEEKRALAGGKSLRLPQGPPSSATILHEAAKADSEILRPVVASPQESLHSVEMPLIATARGAASPQLLCPSTTNSDAVWRYSPSGLLLSLPGGPGCLAGAGRATIPVLVYHQISTPEHPLAAHHDVIDLSRFSEQLEYLHANGYQTISTRQLIDFMLHGTAVPEKAFVLHFDDGWKSVMAALPILERYDFKAAFWIIAGKGIGGDYLDWDDIVGLSRNPHYEVYSHTMTHPWDPENNLLTWEEGKTPARALLMLIGSLESQSEFLRSNSVAPCPIWHGLSGRTTMA